MSLLVQHAGPRCVLNKTRGHRELAVWRRRGPTETSLHWQTHWTEGNRARSVSLDSNRWHVTPDRIHDDCPVQFQTFVGWFLSLNCELAVFLHQFCLAWLSVLFFFLLQKLGQPIHERYIEAEERPKAFEELGRQIQLFMKIIEAYKAKVIWLMEHVCWLAKLFAQLDFVTEILEQQLS